MLSSMMMVGCGDTPETNPGDPILTTITLDVSKVKTTFELNETFAYEGLLVYAHYDDKTMQVVTPTTVSTPDMSTTGSKDVTVTYLTKTANYQITVKEQEPEEEEETYKGHMYFASNTYSLDILIIDKTKYYLNPGIKDKDNKDVDVGDFPFTFEYDNTLVNVSNAGGISSKQAKTGSCVVTCIYTVDTSIKASCTVNIVSSLPTKEKAWVRVDDYDSLQSNDILVIASPKHGAVASLNTLHSKLNPVNATFSSDNKRILSMDEGVAEFYLGIEEKGITLEAQTGEYLVCTHQGKVKLDASSKTNKYWDIHSNIDIEEGTGSLADGAVIENNAESLGYMMYNVSQDYFSTYVDNSISQYMELPFIYRLEEVR